MMDYLNTLINNPSAFIENISKANVTTNIEELNRRCYDALDGTVLHLVVIGLLEPSSEFSFDDATALALVSNMIQAGACPLIEGMDSRIPYEIFHLYDVNPGDYQTYRYLLKETTKNLLDGSCKREFYEDYVNGEDFEFDRTYN